MMWGIVGQSVGILYGKKIIVEAVGRKSLIKQSIPTDNRYLLIADMPPFASIHLSKPPQNHLSTSWLEERKNATVDK